MTGLAFPLRALRRPQVLRSLGLNARRSLHERSALNYRLEQGLGEFMDPAALKAVAVEYQQGLLTRLNEEVKGTEEESMTVADTVINSAMNPAKILAFNYASLALNNHYFLENLKPTPQDAPNHQDKISADLTRQIRTAHGSLAQLKSTVSAAAMGMFSSGWVWFVTDSMGNTGVVPTFGPGSLLVRSQSYIAHTEGRELTDILNFGRGVGQEFTQPSAENVQERIEHAVSEGRITREELERQAANFEWPSTDPTPSPTSQTSPPGTSPSSPASGVSSSQTPLGGRLGPRFMHTSAARRDFELPHVASPYDQGEISDRAPGSQSTDAAKMGQVVFPLFCVSVYEHAWMSAGYGVWGKEEYLKNFWSVVDWEKVSKAYAFYTDAQRQFN